MHFSRYLDLSTWYSLRKFTCSLYHTTFTFCTFLINQIDDELPICLLFLLVEGMSDEEEVDDQLLWNLQILSEVKI